MRINVSQLLKENIGSTRNYKMSEIINIADDGSSSMIQGEVRLMRTNRGILARGKLYTEVEVTCSRCLNSFGCALALNIEEEYFPKMDVVGGAPLPLPDEPGCFTIDEHHILDLTEAIRQYALLAIPMKPLCKVDCAGLCLNCGHNLNRGPCDCSPQETDAHWSKLRELSLASGTSIDKQKGAR